MKNNYIDSKDIAVHQSKIKYTIKGDPYFKFAGRRVKLDECYRV